MKINEKLIEYINSLQVKEGKDVSLKEFDTDYDRDNITKEEGEKLLQFGIEQLAILQDKLYADNKNGVLIILQAMDAAGKDGAIKHVMSGLNPQGVKVTSFKTPSSTELDHDYLWRHYIALPGRGEIGIFNRSHYENVLVTRVHPEYVLNENLPGIDDVSKIDQDFWDKRFRQINNFERILTENGIIVLKFYLHLSKKEQRKRFLERIDNPAKNWKFSTADLKERAYWKEYRRAYEDMMSKTSKDKAPWFVIPADDKWFSRLAIATIIYQAMAKLDLSYPTISKDQRKRLEDARNLLMDEKKNNDNGNENNGN